MATIYGNSGSNNLTGTSGNDSIYGYAGNDTLTGLGGNDRLEGGNDHDTLDGGTGADTMIGGAGDDTYIVDSYSDVITELPGQGVDTIRTLLSYTLSENYVNNLTLTGSSNLSGTGNSYDNVITGNAGNNTLRGNAGKDTLSGGNGIDTLIGGTGDDTYIVDSTTDVITELPGQGVDTVISSVSYTLRENYLNNLTLTRLTDDNNINYDDINATGNSYNNVITGNDGNNILKGGDGNDSIYGGWGNDTIDGDKGNDLLVGGYYIYDDYYGSVLLRGGEGNDTLIAGHYGEHLLYGGSGNDLLDGRGNGYEGGEAYLYGGDGNDTLINGGNQYGENGNDSLALSVSNRGYGGLGNDTITFYNNFYGEYLGGSIGFNTPNEGTDTIINFESGVNKIYVSASGFGGGLTSLPAYSQITAAQFKYGSSATNTNQRFLYDTSTGYLRFDVDGNGSAAATVLAIFQGTPTLTNDDIYVI